VGFLPHTAHADFRHRASRPTGGPARDGRPWPDAGQGHGNSEETVITRRRKNPPTSAELLKAVESSLADDKAEDIVVIDLAGKTSIADHMVIASGRSQRHVGATAEHLVERLKSAGVEPVRAEGFPQCDWVLIDAGDAIVHLFKPEVRSFYNLEKMWGKHRPQTTEVADLIA
jgi:ribosome-associated protein